MTTYDPHPFEWVDAARDRWADYQRVLAESPDNHIAASLRERSLAEMVPHLLVAIGGQWVEVEAWLKARRDRFPDDGARMAWEALDDALDDLREHMHTGTPLGVPVRQHEERG